MEKELTYEAVSQKDKVIEYLENFISSYKEGRIMVKQGEQVIELKPSDNIKIKAVAKQTADKGKFSMKLSWQKQSTEEQPELKISSVLEEEKSEERSNEGLEEQEQEFFTKDESGKAKSSKKK